MDFVSALHSKAVIRLAGHGGRQAACCWRCTVLQKEGNVWRQSRFAVISFAPDLISVLRVQPGVDYQFWLMSQIVLERILLLSMF